MRWVVLFLSLTACNRAIELFPRGDGPGGGSGGIYGTVVFDDWNEYVGTLGVPECPAAPELIVDTTDQALDAPGDTLLDASAAGATLSLPEAIWIASNRAGPDTIRFDPSVFPANAPATILLDGPTFSWELEAVCIDGRGSGVVIDWTQESGSLPLGIWPLRNGSLQVGLTLIHPPYEQLVSGSQIAGCRVSTDGTTRLDAEWGRFWQIEVSNGAIAGPGNVFAGVSGIRVVGDIQGSPTIEKNYFGFDPVTRKRISNQNGVDFLTSSAIVRDNVFATEERGIWLSIFDSATLVQIENNRFGVDLSGAAIPIDGAGFDLGAGTTVFGPNNVVRGAAVAGDVAGPGVKLTQNSISGNTLGIRFSDNAVLPAPSITTASTSQVTGTCPGTGTIEVFSDPGDQGDQYLGSAACADAVSTWTLTAPVPSGRNVTATFTDATHTSNYSPPYAVP